MRDEITFTGIKFEVEFELIKGEKRTQEYSGYCDRIELEEIKHGQDSFFDLLYSDKKEIEEIIYDKLY